MSQPPPKNAIPIRQVIPIIVVTWILALVTTLVIVYFSPNIFPPLTSARIADGAIQTPKLDNHAVTNDKLADGSVTNNNLAPYAIPFTSAVGLNPDSTDSKISWIDINNMSPTITLQRTSQLLIFFNAEAKIDGYGQITVRALVGTESASPYEVQLNPLLDYNGFHDHTGATMSSVFHTHGIYGEGSHTHAFGYMPYSYMFSKSAGPGTYTVKIQWKVTGGVGYVTHRTLTVIALPA